MDAAPDSIDRPPRPGSNAAVTDPAVTDRLALSPDGPVTPNDAEPDGTPSRRWARRRQWGRLSVPPLVAAAVWVAGFAAVVALLANAAARLTANPGVSIIESDTATPILEAQSILQGHVLLNGWRMLYDSYWTVEVPFYALGVLVTGVDPVLMYVVPGVLAALLLITAAQLARERLRGGAAVAAVGTLIALIGLPSDVWATLFLHGAWHVATMLWCLLAFLGLRSSRWGRGWWLAVVLLIAGLLGDLQTVAYGIGPVVLSGILASIRTRRWLAGAPALTAGAAAVLGAVLLRKLLGALGAYTIGTINASASHDQRWENLGNIPSWLPRVFGVGTGEWGHNGVPAALTAVRWVAVVVVLVAVLVALWSMLTGVFAGRPGRTAHGQRPGGESWRIDDMLLLACLADLAFYVYAAQSGLPGYLRYLAPFVVFGSLLAARMAGRAYARMPAGVVRRSIAGAGAALTLLFAASFVVTSVQPVRPVTASDLAAFLADHDLTDGVGSYWTAAMTTVASHDTVRVRPITMQNGDVVRYGRQSTRDWYEGQQFQFLVFDTSDNWGGVNQASVTAALGRPEHVYRVGTYRVLVWPSTLAIDPDRFAG